MRPGLHTQSPHLEPDMLQLLGNYHPTFHHFRKDCRSAHSVPIRISAASNHDFILAAHLIPLPA